MKSKRILIAFGMAVLGTLLFWFGSWRFEEARSIFGSTFQRPFVQFALAHLGWILSGAAFGAILVVGGSREGDGDITVLATALILPVAAIVYFYLWWTELPIPRSLVNIVITPYVQPSASIITGVLAADIGWRVFGAKQPTTTDNE